MDEMGARYQNEASFDYLGGEENRRTGEAWLGGSSSGSEAE